LSIRLRAQEPPHPGPRRNFSGFVVIFVQKLNIAVAARLTGIADDG
jgi:hypothetical protein